ncbi:AAEL009733-PA, partial [Aedes aegypti]
KLLPARGKVVVVVDNGGWTQNNIINNPFSTTQPSEKTETRKRGETDGGETRLIKWKDSPLYRWHTQTQTKTTDTQAKKR